MMVVLLMFLMHVIFVFWQIYRFDQYLLKENHLYVPLSFMHELLICETHEGALMSHFGVANTLDVLHEYFYWSKMKKICNAYVIYALHMGKKSLNSNHMIYILLCLYLRNHW
jgi:hypothetical protein